MSAVVRMNLVDQAGREEPCSIASHLDMAEPASSGDRLHPADRLLDALADAHADQVALIPCGAAVNGAVPLGSKRTLTPTGRPPHRSHLRAPFRGRKSTRRWTFESYEFRSKLLV